MQFAVVKGRGREIPPLVIVAWTQAVGVWTPETIADLDETCPALAFIDAIWTSQTTDAELFRPQRRLDPAKPLEAALAALMGA